MIDVATNFEQLRQRLDVVRTSRAQTVREALRKADAAIAPLRASVERTIAEATKVQGQATPEQALALQQDALASRPLMLVARAAVSELTERLISGSDSFAKGIQDTSAAKELLLLMIMAAAAVGGIGLGLFIGQVGIARPVGRINETLGELSKGNLWSNHRYRAEGRGW